MVFKEKCVRQCPQESAKYVLILTVKGVHILSQLRLLAARLFQIIEYEFVKSINRQERRRFYLHSVVIYPWYEYFAYDLKDYLIVKPTV